MRFPQKRTMQLPGSLGSSPYRGVVMLAAAIMFPFLFAFVFSDAWAQDIDSLRGVPPEEEPPRFTVELIVFTYSDDISAGSEIFVPDRPPVDEYGGVHPDQPADGDSEYVFGDETTNPSADENDASGNATTDRAGHAVDESLPTEIPEITGDDEQLQEIPLRERIELHLLEPDEYTMDAIYNELVKLDAYNPIMRAAWTQTTLAKDVSPAIHLRALGDPPPGLDGSVTLYQGRFLHLGVDLELDANPEDVRASAAADEKQSATDKSIAYGDARVQSGPDVGHDDGGGFIRAPVRYHISEVRIMKSGNIRYYDHPRFGVIAKVTKVEDSDTTNGASSKTGSDNAAAAGD